MRICHLLNFQKKKYDMLYTKMLIYLKRRKCNNLFKPVIKGNVKYKKSLNFFTYFHYFILFWTILWHSIVEKYFMIWYSLEYSIMWKLDLTKTAIINLKEFIVKSINYLGWESNFFIRPPRSLKYCLEVSMNTNQWERLCWKTAYSMILVNNIKWVSSHLSGCGMAKLGSLGRGIFTTKCLSLNYY